MANVKSRLVCQRQGAGRANLSQGRELRATWRQLDRWIHCGDEEPLAEALGHDPRRRLPEVPGIKPQTTAAKVAAIGKAVDRSRGLAGKLGLTPSENSQGSKRRLGNIANRGNRYL